MDHKKKIVLTAAVMTAAAGWTVYADDGSGGTVVSQPKAYMESAEAGPVVGGSQSGFNDVVAGIQVQNNSGKLAVSGPVSQTASVQSPSNAYYTIPFRNSAYDPADSTLYMSASDDDMVRSYEGKTVTGIDFVNVPEAVKTQLLPLLTTKTGDAVSLDNVRKDVSALGGTGVFSQISPAFEEVPEGVKLSYNMTANPVVTKVEFTGNTVFTSEYLTGLLGIQPNSVMNTALISQKVKEIENLYLKQGYLLVTIPNVSIDNSGVLKVNIAEGVIEDIRVSGNQKTRPYVITREMKLKKGKPFNKFLASRSTERIYNLGYFEDVNMRLLPGRIEHEVIVEIDVVEQKTGVATIGAGYSQSDGMVGILELGDNDLRGTGDKINFHWEFGGSSHGRNYQISYTRPWIDSNGDSLGLSIFDRRYDYDDYNAKGNEVASYDKRQKGFNVTLGRVSGDYNTNYITLESKRESYDNYDGFNPGGVMSNQAGDWEDSSLTNSDGSTNVQREWYNAIMNNFGRTNSATFTHIFDSRDNYFDATKGHRLSFSGQVAGHGLGGDYDFYKFTAEGRFYKKLNSRGNVLAFRIMAGYMTGDAPYTQLFSLGGADTVRGYEDDQFKGQNMYEATLEFRSPIVKKVEGVVFCDMGNAWHLNGGKIPWYADSDSLHFGVGVGLRLQTPIGPIRLDFGHGDIYKFHFSFGTQF